MHNIGSIINKFSSTHTHKRADYVRRFSIAGVGIAAAIGAFNASAQTETQFWLLRPNTTATGILAPDPSVPLPTDGTSAPTMTNAVIFDRDHVYYAFGTNDDRIYVADSASDFLTSYTHYGQGGQTGVSPDVNIGNNPAVLNLWRRFGADTARTSTNALGPKALGNGQISQELYMFTVGLSRTAIYAVKSGSTLTGEYIGSFSTSASDSLEGLTVDQHTGLLYGADLSASLGTRTGTRSRFYVYDTGLLEATDLEKTIRVQAIEASDGSPSTSSLASDVTADADGNLYIFGSTTGNAQFPRGKYLYKIVPGKTDGELNRDGTGWTYSTVTPVTGIETMSGCLNFEAAAARSIYSIGFMNGELLSTISSCLYKTNVFTGNTVPVGVTTYSPSFDTAPPNNASETRRPSSGTAYNLATGQVTTALHGVVYEDDSGIGNVIPGTTPGLAEVRMEIYQALDDGRIVLQGQSVTNSQGAYTWLTPPNSTFYVRAVQPANVQGQTWASATEDLGVNVNNPVTAYCNNASGGTLNSNGLCLGVHNSPSDIPAGTIEATVYANEADFLSEVKYASKVVMQSVAVNTVPEVNMAFALLPTEAQLSITKNAPESITVGVPFDYSFSITNDAVALGSSTIVYLADKPPAGITLDAEPAGAAVGSCTINGLAATFPLVGNGSTYVVCPITLTPALSPGQSRTVTWLATADVTTAGSLPVNYASYNPDGSANPPEPGETCTPVQRCSSGSPQQAVASGAPNLTVVKTAPAIVANTPFLYRFAVDNDANAFGPATVVHIADKPPAGIALTAEPEGTAVGSCTIAGTAATFPIIGDGNAYVVCPISLTPALVPGQSHTLTWPATADQSTIGEQPVNHASYNSDGSANPPEPGESCVPAESCTSGTPNDRIVSAQQPPAAATPVPSLDHRALAILLLLITAIAAGILHTQTQRKRKS